MPTEHVPVNDVKVYRINNLQSARRSRSVRWNGHLRVGFHDVGMVVCNH
jgi:hypothetical protein